MKIPSGFQRFVSVVLIFCFLIEITGCQRHSYMMLSSNDIRPERIFVVHTVNKINYKTFNLSINDSIISGNILFRKPDPGQETNAHIYLNSDSNLTVNNDKIEFPLSSVTKMTELVYDKEKSQKATTLLVLGSVAGLALVVIGVIALVDLIKDMEIPEPDPNSTGFCTNW